MNTSGSHLGERVSALADDELDHQARHRALGHVARCDGCRAELDAERALRQLLRGLQDPEPGPALLARLVAVGAPDEAPAPSGGLGAGPTRTSNRPVVTAPPRRRDSVGPAGRSARRRLALRRARVAATGLLGVTVLVLGAFAALGSETAGRGVRPTLPTASFTGVSASTGQGGVSAVTASFLGTDSGPAAVPVPLWTAPAVARAVPMMAHASRP